MASATITSKGQVTIPVQVREKLGLQPGDRIEFVEVEEGRFQLLPATRSIRELEGRYQGKVSRPVSIEEMNAAIARRAAGR
jgi:AbrB family looped-hinge helix DNA binding protein